MLSVELKKKLIDPSKNGIWESITESITSIYNSELFDKPPLEVENYFTRVTLTKRNKTKDNDEIICNITLVFEKTDQDFIKNFLEYTNAFSVNSYAKELELYLLDKYTKEEYLYIAETTLKDLNKTCDMLKNIK